MRARHALLFTLATLTGCFAFFIIVAVIAVTVLLVAQSKSRKAAEQRAEKERLEKEQAARDAPPAWLDPALLPTLLPFGIKAMQIGLRHRGLRAFFPHAL